MSDIFNKMFAKLTLYDLYTDSELSLSIKMYLLKWNTFTGALISLFQLPLFNILAEQKTFGYVISKETERYPSSPSSFIISRVQY